MSDTLQLTPSKQSLDITLSGVNPHWDFVGLKKAVRVHLAESRFDDARELLHQASSQPDRTRALEDNIWLYFQLGELFQQSNDVESACKMFRRAFELDPRSLKIVMAYSRGLMEVERFEEAAQALEISLMYHKHEMPESELVAVYKRLSSTYMRLGNPVEARRQIERALELRPNDPGLMSELSLVIEEHGDPIDVIAMRQERIKLLKSASERSGAFVNLGDDWLRLKYDGRRALDCYEQAVLEEPNNTDAFLRICETSRQLEDWRTVWRGYMALARLSKSPKERADWLIRGSEVARFELWETDCALIDLKRALESDPERLDALKSLSSILVDAEEWPGLENAYLQFIRNYEVSNPEDKSFLARVNQKLAELYKTQLDRPKDAIVTYDKATQYSPGATELHYAVVDMAETYVEYGDLVIEHLRALIGLQGISDELLERLGKAYLRVKRVDEAVCVFRALQSSGGTLDVKASHFLQQFESPIVRIPKGLVNTELLANYVLDPRLKSPLTDVFATLAPILQEWVGESRSKYGLRRRDRVKSEESLVFNNLYKAIGNSLGYVEMPELWRSTSPVGLLNGALVPAGMIVGEDLLASAQEKYAGFIIAKQLFLFLPPFYLAGVRPLTDLHGFLLRAKALASGDEELTQQFVKDGFYKHLKKKLRGQDLGTLQHYLQPMNLEQLAEDLSEWVEALEDSANRVGFVYCDDLSVAKNGLESESQPISGRSINERMQSLIDYSIDEKYLSLRPKLGISVA